MNWSKNQIPRKTSAGISTKRGIKNRGMRVRILERGYKMR
jgi:tetraacyldisaccharide-1-P 4'-kinase